ncbi:hypothetical protein E2C01_075477 [Portunus trituberculatus]|uniref:Uncharacterized protein n=1 Tax=Portunus trituberculatus TaxID=210409 RepID=A0A5B7I670_PORTR|nr:hypothetical protein [Portunus trituberculatus]
MEEKVNIHVKITRLDAPGHAAHNLKVTYGSHITAGQVTVGQSKVGPALLYRPAPFFLSVVATSARSVP